MNYNDINSMLSNLELVDEKYTEKNNHIPKKEQTFSGFSRDVSLFKPNNINLNFRENNRPEFSSDKKNDINERLNNYTPIPCNKSYPNNNTHDPINFQLDNFKNQKNNNNINEKLSLRGNQSSVKNFNLSESKELPINNSLPIDSQYRFDYNSINK